MRWHHSSPPFLPLRRHGSIGVLALVLALLISPPASALENTAQATLNGLTLDVSQATVTLNRVSVAATSALMEISPDNARTDQTLSFGIDLAATIEAGQSGYDRTVVTAPAGFTIQQVQAVQVDGVTLVESCPTPAAGTWCASLQGGSFELNLGSVITADAVRVHVDAVATTSGQDGSFDFTGTVNLRANTVTAPVAVIAGNADGDATDANTLSVNLTGLGFDPDTSEVTVSPPLLLADGMAQATVTVIMRGANGQPVPGILLNLATDRGLADDITAQIGPTDATGTATGILRSTTAGTATVQVRDSIHDFLLTDQPQVTFTRGLVLQLTKIAAQPRAVVGDVVTYLVRIRNQDDRDVTGVTIVDTPPPGLRYLAGSATLGGQSLADPAGGAVALFDIGTVPGFIDSDGNGVADAGESGFLELRYRMIVGSGARPGMHVNRATAIDVCEQCIIANETTAELEVMLDPVFDLGTIIGKVFHDSNGDGWQQLDEAGIGEVMVALDDGTYALTDNHGRYHFPAVRPGQRLVKLNRNSLPGIARNTTDGSQILNLTPGLMAKANFGVRYETVADAIGRPGKTGIATNGDAQFAPVTVSGSTRMPFAVVNGQPVDLRVSDVTMTTRSIDNVLTLENGHLRSPVQFRFVVKDAAAVQAWRLNVADVDGRPVHQIAGEGTVPPSVQWDGRNPQGEQVISGGMYHYQLSVDYQDGNRSESERRLFGVNRTASVSVNLRGGAFVTGSHQLTDQARQLLKETAVSIRNQPGDKIAIEGHTDWVGSDDNNRELSRRRAEAALNYLVDVEGLPRERFVVFGYGESRPVASNQNAAGREHNRRVEIKGDLTSTDRALLRERVRATPSVRINGETVAIAEHGRFSSMLQVADSARIELDISSASSRRAQATVRLPALEILQPTGEALIPFGTTTDQYTVFEAGVGIDDSRPLARFRVVGRTAPGNAVEIDGVPVVVDNDGLFASSVTLTAGQNIVGILARNSQGFSRIVNLTIGVSTGDGGQPLIVVDPIPVLSLRLPPRGMPLVNETLVVPGFTDPANRLVINGEPVEVDATGQFFVRLDVPVGESLFRAEVRDPDGYAGVIERTFERRDNQWFFMALADGKFGQLRNNGSLEGSDQSSTIAEGRIAYYFKGKVKGKYLITSAFDTGLDEYGRVFGDFDGTDNQRLIANIDPDTVYPVYGDNSTLVYDAQSRGRFYIAVESSELEALVGNYPINLSDTELAAYQRTLYGAQVRYASEARNSFGDARTAVQAFVADVPQAPVRDELRATGGSLYFLSQRDVIEGSEQVVIVVRDKDTGLNVSRTRQTRNVDYTIRYTDGRLLFNRPVSSVSADGSLIDHDLLAGNPAYVEITYETRLDGFDQASSGVRARKILGDRIGVGVTHVADTMLNGDYSLSAVDAEVRLGSHSRLLAEYATSSGDGAATFTSTDGGFTYAATSQGQAQKGNAFKLAVELDVGEFIGQPEKLTLDAYLKQLDDGFASAGNRSEAASAKSGLALSYAISPSQRLRVRHDRSEALATGARVDQSTLGWTLSQGRWKLSTELQDRRERDGNGGNRQAAMAAARIEVDWTDSLSTHLEHQQTLQGIANDQTTMGMRLAAGKALAFRASATSGSRGSAAEAGLTLDVAGKHFYLSQRIAGDLAGSERLATVLGAESPFGENGELYTEYQWGGPTGMVDSQSLVGVRRRWDRSNGLSVSMSAEQSTVDASAGPTKRYALAAGVSYDSGSGFKLSNRNELRNERGGQALNQFLSITDLNFGVSPSMTLLGKLRYGHTRNPNLPANDMDFSEVSVGVAWRPVTNDRFNALARYTRSNNAPTAFQRIEEVTEYTRDVFAADWSWQISRQLEWAGKAALKMRQEQGNSPLLARTSTWLSVQRLNLGLPMHLELGTEYRVLSQREADDQRSGWATELSWGGMQHLRIGAGFNFTDFSDNVYEENDYSSYGWFFRLQGKY